MLSKDNIQKGLKAKRIGKKMFVFESIDSTNTCARTLAETGTEEGTVVVTDFQTQGKGRMGRRWQAAPGTSLLFSTVLRPPLTHEVAGLLTFFSAVSVARAIEHETNLAVECKWPNDLLVQGRKVCGILLENSFEKESLAYSVAGVGLNVLQRDFDPSLEKKATSIAREAVGKVDRTKLLRRILTEMDVSYNDVCVRQFASILDEWKSRCTMFGKPVTVMQHDTEVKGSAVGLSPEGGLILKTPQGMHTVFAGDVTFVSA